jgi:hypothetical protein
MTDREYDTDLALWADSRARELASRIAITMIHLMKLEASPAHEPPGTRLSRNSAAISSGCWRTRRACGRPSPG